MQVAKAVDCFLMREQPTAFFIDRDTKPGDPETQSIVDYGFQPARHQRLLTVFMDYRCIIPYKTKGLKTGTRTAKTHPIM